MIVEMSTKQGLSFSDYASYQFSGALNIPPRALNGGLYTGEPFRENAPHGNLPALPDAGYLIHYNLRSANPPDAALYQYPGGERIGNNTAIMPGISMEQGKLYNMACRLPSSTATDPPCQCRKCTLTKYAYL